MHQMFRLVAVLSFIFIGTSVFANNQSRLACHCWVATMANPNLFYAGHAFGTGASFAAQEADAKKSCQEKAFLENQTVIEIRLSCAR
jgi:hypothetical protein